MNQSESVTMLVEEFSRLQHYIRLVSDKDSQLYHDMLERYHDIKALLTFQGMNMTDIDRLKL